MLYNTIMKEYKTRITEYAEWGWGRAVPYFCATTSHHETELIRLVKGNGEIYINGERYALKKGDLYIVRPLILHSIRKTGDIAPVVDFVKFDLRRLAEDCPPEVKIGDYLHFFNDKNAPCVVNGDIAEYDAEQIITPLFEEGSERGKTQQAIFNLLKLLHEHRNLMHIPNITEERQHYAAQIIMEYISSNYAKRQIKVSDVAALVGYDEFYTMKLFKKFCGWSIIDYLNGVRVIEAKRQLVETNRDVHEIAQSVGYKSASYFNRQFKKTFNVTPSELRLQTV